MGVQEQYPFDVEAVRADFPILDRLVGGDPESPGEGPGDDTPLVYLDSAATSQTPDPVVDTIADYYRGYNANVHRGIHQLSQEALALGLMLSCEDASRQRGRRGGAGAPPPPKGLGSVPRQTPTG